MRHTLRIDPPNQRIEHQCVFESVEDFIGGGSQTGFLDHQNFISWIVWIFWPATRDVKWRLVSIDSD